MRRYIKYFNTYFRLWWRRLLRNWVAKLVSLLLAVLLWSFVNSAQNTTSQRSLTVVLSPLSSSSQVVTGVPDSVEVVVSGKSQRIERLKGEEISAVLDLLDVEGKFKKDIHVAVPLGISLLKVTPKEIIGTVEPLAKASLPVKVSFLSFGEPNLDLLLNAEVFPQDVAALGRADLIEQAVAAVALTTSIRGSTKVQLYAADASGQTLPEISLRPAEATLTVRRIPILHSKEVPIVINFLEARNLKIQTSTLSGNTAMLIGASQQLSELTKVQASADLIGLGPGEHDLELNWVLPVGVSVLNPPTIEVQLELAPIPSP